MLDCTKSLELLSDYRDGSLDEVEVVLVRSHLDGCPPCTGIFHDLEVIVITARSLSSEESIAFPDENIIWQRIGTGRNGGNGDGY